MGTPTTNFALADDIALLVPTVRAFNSLLNAYEVFAKENLWVFITVKSEFIFIPALGPATFVPPNVCLRYCLTTRGAHYHTESN